jgi:hypothetical protein
VHTRNHTPVSLHKFGDKMADAAGDGMRSILLDENCLSIFKPLDFVSFRGGFFGGFLLDGGYDQVKSQLCLSFYEYFFCVNYPLKRSHIS